MCVCLHLCSELLPCLICKLIWQHICTTCYIFFVPFLSNHSWHWYVGSVSSTSLPPVHWIPSPTHQKPSSTQFPHRYRKVKATTHLIWWNWTTAEPQDTCSAKGTAQGQVITLDSTSGCLFQGCLWLWATMSHNNNEGSNLQSDSGHHDRDVL